MPSQVIEFLPQDLFPIAKDSFLKMGGLNLNSDKHRRIWERALEIYSTILPTIRPSAIVMESSAFTLVGKELTVDQVCFVCNAFEQIHDINLLRVYSYLLTIGDVPTIYESVSDALYGDLWGTAFVDAVREKLNVHFKKTERVHSADSTLSDSFGPGYYGMEITQISTFIQLLDPDKIGIHCTESGMLVPQKSCTGMCLAVSDAGELPPSACSSCVGAVSNCQFCSYYPKRKGI